MIICTSICVVNHVYILIYGIFYFWLSFEGIIVNKILNIFLTMMKNTMSLTGEWWSQSKSLHFDVEDELGLPY